MFSTQIIILFGKKVLISVNSLFSVVLNSHWRWWWGGKERRESANSLNFSSFINGYSPSVFIWYFFFDLWPSERFSMVLSLSANLCASWRASWKPLLHLTQACGSSLTYLTCFYSNLRGFYLLLLTVRRRLQALCHRQPVDTVLKSQKNTAHGRQSEPLDLVLSYCWKHCLA